MSANCETEIAALRARVAELERDAAAHAQADQAAQALVEIDREILSTLDPAQVTERIVTTVLALFRVQRALLYRWDSAGGLLVCVATAGASDRRQWLGQTLHPGEAIAGQALQRCCPCWVPDLLTAEDLFLPAWVRSLLADEPFRAAAGAPLVARGRVLGVLAIGAATGREFTQAEMGLLSAFADRAAIAIENARLHETALKRANQLATVNELARILMTVLESEAVAREILAAIQILLPGTVGQLWEQMEGGGSLRLVACVGLHATDGRFHPTLDPHEGLAGIAVGTRQPVSSADVIADPRFVNQDWARSEGLMSALAIPLVYREQILGALVFLTRTPHIFPEEEIDLLRSFGTQAAIALENARLFGTRERELAERIQAEAVLRERTRQIEAVRSISAEITKELDLGALLELIARRAEELIGGVLGTVFLWDERERVLTPQAWIRDDESRWKLPLRLGEGVVGTVAARRAGMIVNDYQDSPYAHATAISRFRMAASLAHPLLYHDRLIGVLALAQQETGRGFSQPDLDLLGLFAAQAAIAIENARLFADLNDSYHTLQRTQAELIRSQKLHALGQMAAGIAHDLNNMLAAILGQVELLRLRTQDPEVREGLALLGTAATDGAEVVRRLQDFARQRPSHPLAPLELAPVVHEALEITRPRWKDQPQQRGVVIHVEHQPADLPPILGHAPEIREVLTNLILNAVDAMPQGGTLRITARPHPGGGAQRSGVDTESSDTPSDFVELVISDSGVGMSEEVRQQIFDPFFTTKGVQGMGLGLSVAYGIMERHRGRIQVASTPGQGTTFTLRFQAAGAPGVARSIGMIAGPRPARRILFVDDDDRVRQTLADLLRAVGHTVIEASSGTACLQRLAEAPVDAVLTDLGMPELTGWDVAREVKTRTPHVPVILLTGWGDQLAASEDERARVDRILGKPVRLQDLLGVIAELTSGPPNPPG